MDRQPKSFSIRFALNPAGALVQPESCEQDMAAVCPACRAPVVLRKVKNQRARFSHRTNGECSADVTLQRIAELLLVQVVEQWKRGGPAPVIVRRCIRCDGQHPQHLPAKVASAAVNSSTPSGVPAGVVLRDETGTSLAAIEVVHPEQPVAETAAGDKGVPWFRVMAKHVVEEPLRWFPIHDALMPFKHCAACNARAEEAAARYDANGYMCRETECWKCHRSIEVFCWRSKFTGAEGSPPPPIPPTVQFRFSNTAGEKYWANVCPHCNSIQGDFFLYSEPDGPFWGEHDDDACWEEEIRVNGLRKPVAWSPAEIQAHLRDHRRPEPGSTDRTEIAQGDE